MPTVPVTRRTRLGAALLATALAITAVPWIAPVAVAQDATGTLEVEAIGGLVPDVTATCDGPATDTEPDGSTVVVPFEGASSMELPAGTCDIAWTEPSGEPNGLRVLISAGRTTWVRGGLLSVPWARGEQLTITDLAGTTIWDDVTTPDDRIWVLPGLYTVADGATWTLEVQVLPGTVTLTGISVDRPSPSQAPEPTPAPTPRPTPRPTPTSRPQTTRVPDLVGLDVADAGALARRFGLRLAVSLQETTDVDPGIVLDQDPGAGTAALQGDIVRVIVARAAQLIVVPDVTLLTEEDAIALLLDAGLTPGRRTTQTSVDVPEGRVITTDPAPGALVRPGASVAWVASEGPPAGVTPRPTPTFSLEPTAAPVVTPTPRPTPRPTPPPTATPRPTPRPTPIPTATPSPTPIPTPTPSPSATAVLVAVPDLAGTDEPTAREILAAVGLETGRVQLRANRRVPAGQVIRTVPPAGSVVAEGTPIRLILSSGAPVASVEPSPEPTPEPTTAPLPSPSPSLAPTVAPSASVVPSGSPLAGSHLADVMDAGVLRVNIAPDDPPWSSVNGEGQPSGFEIQLARRIGRQLGVEVTFTSFPTEALLDGSTAGQWDLALGHLPAMDPVTTAFLTTQPYAWDPLAAAVATDRAPVPEDLTGLVVCVRDAAPAQQWLDGLVTLTHLDGFAMTPPVVTTLPVATAQECADALADGTADAWIDSRTTLDAAAAGGALAVGATDFALVPIAGAVEPADGTDTSLIDAVDAAVAALRDDGQLLRISRRAFDADLVTGPPPPTPEGSPGPSPEPSAIAVTDPGRS